MSEPRRIDRFGPLTLDRQRRLLTRDGRAIHLNERQMGVLLELTREPGALIPRNKLIANAWAGTAVTDDSLRKALSYLRDVCGPGLGGPGIIVLRKRRGYQWTAPLDHGATPVDLATMTELDADPQAAIVQARRALETLLRDGIVEAAKTFADVLAGDQPLPAAHAGLAAALVLQFESTRADRVPDRDVLLKAQQHAIAAWQQAPDSAEAWTSLALVCHCAGHAQKALVAARRAVACDAHDWQHHLVHAYVGSGAERLRAASRVLELSPQNAIAHWFAATVLVARQAMGKALDHLRAGCAMQDHQRQHADRGGVLQVAGMHLLRGQVLAAVGDIDGAVEALQRELAGEGTRQIYEREACANACYTLGILARRGGDDEHALDWMREAQRRIPGHRMSKAVEGLEGRERREGIATLQLTGPNDMDDREAMTAAIVRAGELVLAERHDEAAAVVMTALRASAWPVPGNAWSIPVEPLLNVSAQTESWSAMLALLHQRAS